MKAVALMAWRVKEATLLTRGDSSDSESHDGAVGAGDGSQSVVGCADGSYVGKLVDGGLVGHAEGE